MLWITCICTTQKQIHRLINMNHKNINISNRLKSKTYTHFQHYPHLLVLFPIYTMGEKIL